MSSMVTVISPVSMSRPSISFAGRVVLSGWFQTFGKRQLRCPPPTGFFHLNLVTDDGT